MSDKKKKSRKKRVSSTGKKYEGIVASIHRQLDKEATITENELINGRQIDVAIRKTIAGINILIIVECKDYKRKIEVGKVDEVIGKMQDTRAAKAILVSDSGFTQGARNRAIKNGYVELISVIDVASPSLKTRVGITLRAEKHALLPPAGPIRLIYYEDAIPTIHEATFLGAVKTAYSNAIDWYNGNIYELCSGKHVHSQEFEHSGHTFRLECTFNKEHKRYINTTFWVFGVGTLNHITSTLTYTQISGQIDLENDPGWQEVPDDFDFDENIPNVKQTFRLEKTDVERFSMALVEAVTSGKNNIWIP